MNRDNLHDSSGAALIVRVFEFGKPALIEFWGFNSQPFVPTLYSGLFIRDLNKKDRLVFDWTIPNRTQNLILRDNILDNFCDLKDFANPDDVSFFANDALEAALNSSRE